MRSQKFHLSFILFVLAFLNSGAGTAPNHEAEGRIVKIEAAQREIYVFSQGDKLEYYFNQQTQVYQQGSPKQFEDLKEGLAVRVSSRKIGKRLDPIKVEILD